MSQTTGRTKTLRTSRNAIKIINQAGMGGLSAWRSDGHTNGDGQDEALPRLWRSLPAATSQATDVHTGVTPHTGFMRPAVDARCWRDDD